MRTGGPKTPEGKAKALANLIPHKRPNWKPGEVPNPAGRPAAGLAIIENVNLMQGLTRAEVEKVANDPAAPLNKRVAAKRWLAADDGTGADFDRIIDRTVGKPKGDDGAATTVNVNVTQLSRDDLVRIATTGGRRIAEA